MQFRFEIDVDNDAFLPDPSGEVARLLELAATRMRESGVPTGQTFKLRDINGTTVGFYVLEENR